ncbi:hypothetical protein J1614_009045 [Plenodomus biglobosus]|nr:hypothetical protein J1614_009045 [Plenodomus biglobosus]
MSEHSQRKSHRAFSFHSFLHREKGPSLGTRLPHRWAFRSRIAIGEAHAKEFQTISKGELFTQGVPLSSKSARRSHGFDLPVFGFLFQLRISRPQDRVPINVCNNEPPPPYSSPRKESSMDYQTSVQELPNTERRINELFDPNSYYELPASPHHNCVELAGDDIMPCNPLKRSPHTTRKALREYHLGPITTPSPIPLHSPGKYSQDAPGMTYEDISPVSPSQSPLTPSTNSVPNARQHSRLSVNISPLTEHEMPLPALSQDVEVTGFQNQVSSLESPPYRQPMMPSVEATSSMAGFANQYDINSLPYTAYYPLIDTPQYPILGQNLAPLLYPPSSYVQAGLNQRENSAWYHGYKNDLRVFSTDKGQYYNVNAGQENWPVPGVPHGDNISWHVQPAMPAVWQTGKPLSTVCETCGVMFHGRYCKGNKKRHVKTKHDNNQPTLDRTCSFCHRLFNRADAARKHERNAHKSELLNPTKERK